MEMEELNWTTFLKQGNQYFNAATPKGKKSKFDNDTVYNMLSMALEGFIMAILDFHKNLPDNHTYTDLMDGLERVMPVDKALREKILKYEKLQDLCSLDPIKRIPPTNDELKDLYAAIGSIKDMAHTACQATT